MGLILMIGSIILTYVVYKHNSGVLASHAFSSCKTEGDLNINNEVKYIMDSGEHFTIVTKKSGGTQEVIRYSPCEQKIISRTKIKFQDD